MPSTSTPQEIHRNRAQTVEKWPSPAVACTSRLVCRCRATLSETSSRWLRPTRLTEPRIMRRGRISSCLAVKEGPA